MSENRHTVLCVDDEENILRSLTRMLRKENLQLLTASSGAEALKILEEHEVHLVISDQRMPGMNGTEFLSLAREKYPDMVRIILTGFTDVDSITESVNQGYVYKFFLKPWSDQGLKQEIMKALEDYDLKQLNQTLHEEVLQRNQELRTMNEKLEDLVRHRTKELEIQNKALEMSQAILEDLPVPIIGMSTEGTIVLINKQAQNLSSNGRAIEIGKNLDEYFSKKVMEAAARALSSHMTVTVAGYKLSEDVFDIELIPLAGTFRGKGVIITLKPSRAQQQAA